MVRYEFDAGGQNAVLLQVKQETHGPGCLAAMFNLILVFGPTTVYWLTVISLYTYLWYHYIYILGLYWFPIEGQYTCCTWNAYKSGLDKSSSCYTWFNSRFHLTVIVSMGQGQIWHQNQILHKGVSYWMPIYLECLSICTDRPGLIGNIRCTYT